MTWKTLKKWFHSNATHSPKLKVYPTLDDRQKTVYNEWRDIWENGGNLAIMMALEKRIYELEKEKNNG